MLKEASEWKFLGRHFSRYRLSLKLIGRITESILKNVHPSGDPIWPHPLRCGPLAVPQVQLHGPTPCGCSHLDS
jgi:hypothetical protein